MVKRSELSGLTGQASKPYNSIGMHFDRMLAKPWRRFLAAFGLNLVVVAVLRDRFLTIIKKIIIIIIIIIIYTFYTFTSNDILFSMCNGLGVARGCLALALASYMCPRYIRDLRQTA